MFRRRIWLLCVQHPGILKEALTTTTTASTEPVRSRPSPSPALPSPRRWFSRETSPTRSSLTEALLHPGKPTTLLVHQRTENKMKLLRYDARHLCTVTDLNISPSPQNKPIICFPGPVETINANRYSVTSSSSSSNEVWTESDFYGDSSLVSEER